MDHKDGPPTIQVDDEPAQWESTHVDDVFLPAVRVSLAWRDVEAAVEQGAVVPAQAHALWAAWAAPGSPTRQSVPSGPVVTEFHSTIADLPMPEESRAPAPSLAMRIGGPLAGAVVGSLLTWMLVGG
ncbi:hypothetical protein [Hydrogenophaga sp.]|uniref:hypothetical protein n=1 Tax=Hydrogenophaga sp. TaxID=1904254 RepID=UPI0025BB66C1|nr:hypothetical protein [Hydrogenophaga sp.]